MGYLYEGLASAFKLLFSLDPEFWGIVFLTLRVSLTATILAAAVGVPVAFAVVLKKFRGREALLTVVNSLMALPTVAVGLLVYTFLSRRGPLGFLGLLHTPWAIVAGEVILALPIITALAVAALRSLDERAVLTARTLGAGRRQAALVLVSECRYALLAAVVAGFARVVTEVGSAVMVGGNIARYTRTMATAIAMETSRGEFGLGLGLGIVLIAVALGVNAGVRTLEGIGQ